MGNRFSADILMVCTNYFSLRAFLIPLEQMLSDDFKVCLVANLTPEEQQLVVEEFGSTIQVIPVTIKRKPDFISDIRCLCHFILILKSMRPKMVFTIMPKAGLLGMLAAFICRVPARVHCFTGQVWLTQSGLKRWFYKNIDRVISLFSTSVLADGKRQRDYIISQKIVAQHQIDIIWNGSIAGIESKTVRLDNARRRLIRSDHGVSDGDILILHMARMTREKGFFEVISVFNKLSSTDGRYKLMLVGPDEEGLIEKSRILSQNNVVYMPYSNSASDIIQICDVFVSPSHREGLPMTLLLALSLDRLVFVSDVYGNNDLVRDGCNGYLHEVGDVDTLSKQILRVINGDDSRNSKNISRDILMKFDRKVFKKHFRNYISGQIDKY